MVKSTLAARIQFGVDLEPEDDPIECAIHETHDYLFRFQMWCEQVDAATDHFLLAMTLDYRTQVELSIFELEMLGWHHEPLPDVYPELVEWLCYLP